MDPEKIQPHILKKYEVVKKLGSGAYGHVWKVRDLRTSKIYALKKIFDAFQHSTDAQRTYREITVLKQLHHPNIIGLHETIAAENDRDIYLLFEYMETDVHNVICEGLLQDVHKRYIIYQVLLALKYLHSAELVHRDLKPSNLLLNSDCLTKICDFGLIRSVAKAEKDQGPVLTEGVATRWYRAPEVLLGSKDYNQQADMWSLGCIIAEIYLQKPLLPGTSILNQLQRILSITGRPNATDLASLKSEQAKNMIDQIKHIKVKELKELFGSGHDMLIDLVGKLLQFNPTKRLSAVEAIQHPYLADFANTKDETEFKGKIKFEVSDNVKLTIADYKRFIYGNAEKDQEFESPKKFSDLRKLSVNKDSKETPKQSKNSSNAFSMLQGKKPASGVLPSQPTSSTNDTLNTRHAVSPKNVFHRPAMKANSPNSFKDIIQQQQKENRQVNGTFAGRLGDLLKGGNDLKRPTIGDGLSPKSPIKASQTLKTTFSSLYRNK